MGRSSTTHPLVDRILDGRLDELLLTWRAENQSLQDITFRLRSEHDVKVSVATVHRWVSDLESEDGAA